MICPAHEIHGRNAIVGWIRNRKHWWTGTGWTDQPAGAQRYRGNHDVMATANRLRADRRMSLLAMMVSVVSAPKVKTL